MREYVKHDWVWDGGIDLQYSDGEFYCNTCGEVICADVRLAVDYVDEENCIIEFKPKETTVPQTKSRRKINPHLSDILVLSVVACVLYLVKVVL